MVLLRHASKLLIVLTLALSLGAHWALLQSVAWVGMVMNYAQNATVGEALSKTFNGENPCQLCTLISKERAEEKKQDQKQLKTELKLDIGIACELALFKFGCERDLILSPDLFALSKHESPPKPPPRISSSTTFV